MATFFRRLGGSFWQIDRTSIINMKNIRKIDIYPSIEEIDRMYVYINESDYFTLKGEQECKNALGLILQESIENRD